MFLQHRTEKIHRYFGEFGKRMKERSQYYSMIQVERRILGTHREGVLDRNLKLCNLHQITPPPWLCLSTYATNPFNYITSSSFSSKIVVISWSQYRQIGSLRENHPRFFLWGPIRDKSFELQKGFYPS